VGVLPQKRLTTGSEIASFGRIDSISAVRMSSVAWSLSGRLTRRVPDSDHTTDDSGRCEARQ
jgi:hypothetical protein